MAVQGNLSLTLLWTQLEKKPQQNGIHSLAEFHFCHIGFCLEQFLLENVSENKPWIFTGVNPA